MPELLIELFSEEIPARMQARATEDLKRLVTEGLTAAGLSFTDARAYATPRRLALVVDGLPERTADIKEERRGPRADAPEKAIAGFTGALPPGTPVEARETPKGNFLFAVVEKAGEPTTEVVGRTVRAVAAGFPWPKSMRWGDAAFRWVRPLQNVLAIFDGRPLDAGVVDGADRRDTTAGHRFLAPEPFAVSGFADYRTKLRDAFVILDPAERRAEIARQLAAVAEAEGLRLKDDPGLLDEVTGLVEWPHVVVGRIDERFMDVPPEVLTTSMRTHQKYFALLRADGGLAPRFALVANTDRPGAQANIAAGNERVLRARLSDAKFFWDQDRAIRLGDRVPRLSGMTFHEKLGSVGDKVDRIEALAAHIATHVPGADPAPVRAAARLAKADLVSGMVGEFPELQGLMGRYYALHDGEDAAVADAVAEHYAPQGPNDRCPVAPVSVAVALADKIDTLVGFWAVGETPTGSRDPYALRRAALGVIRIVLENSVRINLLPIFSRHLGVFDEEMLDRDVKKKRKLLDQAESTAPIPYGFSQEHLTKEGLAPYERRAWDLMAFFAERLKVHLRERGVRHDLIAAILGRPGADDLVLLMARANALSTFVATEDGANLLAAYRRATNIVRIEEKKDGQIYRDVPNVDLLRQDEERALAAAMAKAVPAAEAALGAEDFTAAMAALAGLRGPLDAFFDKVTVNAEDAALRANRLRLLSGIRRTMETVADFGQIEG